MHDRHGKLAMMNHNSNDGKVGDNAHQSAAGKKRAAKSKVAKSGEKLPKLPRNPRKAKNIVVDPPVEVKITGDYYLGIRLPAFAATKISVTALRPMAQQQRRVRISWIRGKPTIQYYNASGKSKTSMKKLFTDNLPADFVRPAGAVEVHTTFHYKLPLRPAGKKVGDPYDKKVDLDNLQKLIFDAMTGIFYGDDSMVCRMSAEKLYGDFDGTTIYVTKMM